MTGNPAPDPSDHSANPVFLSGGGEAGAFIRRQDWSTTPAGTSDQWPQSLRTTLSLILNAGLPMLLFWGDDHLCFYNDAYRSRPGNDNLHPDALGKPGAAVFADTWPDTKRLIDQVLTRGEAIRNEDRLVSVQQNGRREDVYQTDSYSPVSDESGRPVGVLVTCIDTPQTVGYQRQQDESYRQMFDSFDQSPIALAIISGPDLRFRMANAFYGQLVGRTPDQLIGQSLMAIMPELTGQGFDGLLLNVMATGVPYAAPETAVTLRRDNQLEISYVDLSFQPQPRRDDQPASVLIIATNVTQQVLARRRVEASEATLRSIVTNVPAALVLFVGRELIVEMPSQNFIDIIDRGPDVTGRPLSELMPELENQSFLSILDDVFTTGKPYSVFGTCVDITQGDGSVTHDFFNLVYTPLFNAEGQVYAILSIASNVTEVVKAKLAQEEAEKNLRGAIELAELATWSLDIDTGQFHYSARFMHWLGFSVDSAPTDQAYNPVPEVHRRAVTDAIAEAIRPGSAGLYDHEHPIVNQQTGQLRIIHAQAQVFYNEAGQPVVLSGTAQDVTQQREIQLSLEQQVRQHTEELATTNEELMASTEELMVANEETLAANEQLRESNDLLSRSNENLLRFAYVASHDLQEPLRKVQQFGDLLKSRYADQLGNGADYLDRMQAAASRMSTLIRDLLAFSRIATQRDSSDLISLTAVVGTVLTDMDLTIQESGATVSVVPLPTVLGDALQLSQLFQNLLSNALKFHRPGVAPAITIHTSWLAASSLPPDVRPSGNAIGYHRIDVTDNGIGFDEKYLDRIFQVFQRLHGRSDYAGTGIGLAICEKVVTNHGGAITATSQPGQGSVFSVYLPV